MARHLFHFARNRWMSKMKIGAVARALRAAFVAISAMSNRELLLRFRDDQSGGYVIIVALMLPVLIAAVGLGTDTAQWFYTHQKMQGAAESAAVSASTAGQNLTTEAAAVTASYGFINGENGVTLTVNQPPKSGAYTTTAGAVEVVLDRLQTPQFSAVIFSKEFTISARAVAVGTGGTGCLLALDRSASGAISAQGSAQVTLKDCNLYDNSASGSALSLGGSSRISTRFVGVVGGISGASSITATSGISTGVAPTADPYAAASFPSYPSFCTDTNLSVKTSKTISAGVYCGGITLSAGAVLTLNPGIYYLNKGSLSVAGNATLTGHDVTLVFTSSTGSNWADAKISSNAIINLTSPTTGPTAGIVLFGDRNMSVSTTLKLNGGGSQTFGGAIYVPKGAVDFSGGSTTNVGCTQIVANTIVFSGSANLAVDCASFGTKMVGSGIAKLVE